MTAAASPTTVKPAPFAAVPVIVIVDAFAQLGAQLTVGARLHVGDEQRRHQ